MTRAMDYFDLAADYGGVARQRLSRRADAFLRHFVHQRLAVSDAGIARHRACAERGRRQRLASPKSTTDKGHDAFLLDEPELFTTVRGFLEGAAKARGLPPVRS